MLAGVFLAAALVAVGVAAQTLDLRDDESGLGKLQGDTQEFKVEAKMVLHKLDKEVVDSRLAKLQMAIKEEKAKNVEALTSEDRMDTVIAADKADERLDCNCGRFNDCFMAYGGGMAVSYLFKGEGNHDGVLWRKCYGSFRKCSYSVCHERPQHF